MLAHWLSLIILGLIEVICPFAAASCAEAYWTTQRPLWMVLCLLFLAIMATVCLAVAQLYCGALW